MKLKLPKCILFLIRRTYFRLCWGFGSGRFVLAPNILRRRMEARGDQYSEITLAERLPAARNQVISGMGKRNKMRTG